MNLRTAHRSEAKKKPDRGRAIQGNGASAALAGCRVNALNAIATSSGLQPAHCPDGSSLPTSLQPLWYLITVVLMLESRPHRYTRR